ncbi:dihydrofolate reductase family protein [Priestia flexa]|uniref:dihydrofolate reductase family protein n=1 Tax=Priestia flexa TaxID=86664 RepID=UPI0010FC33CB|nr:dihydrofolate reductase family protein [Priestia flexa]QCS53284.1 dihydrofolate reductase [Priestia flexa]
MTRKVILYIATTIDGFIARENGKIDWLVENETNEDYGYNEFDESIDTVFMGRHTYEQVLTFGEFPYKGKEVFVVTTKKGGKSEDVTFISPTEVHDKVTELKKLEGKNIFLVGGGSLNALFLNENLIDEYWIFQKPILLGSGIPLFQGNVADTPLSLIDSKIYPSGFVFLKFVNDKKRLGQNPPLNRKSR